MCVRAFSSHLFWASSSLDLPGFFGGALTGLIFL